MDWCKPSKSKPADTIDGTWHHNDSDDDDYYMNPSIHLRIKGLAEEVFWKQSTLENVQVYVREKLRPDFTKEELETFRNKWKSLPRGPFEDIYVALAKRV